MKIRRQWTSNNFVIVISKILPTEGRRNKSQCEKKVFVFFKRFKGNNNKRRLTMQ